MSCTESNKTLAVIKFGQEDKILEINYESVNIIKQKGRFNNNVQNAQEIIIAENNHHDNKENSTTAQSKIICSLTCERNTTKPFILRSAVPNLHLNDQQLRKGKKIIIRNNDKITEESENISFTFNYLSEEISMESYPKTIAENFFIDKSIGHGSSGKIFLVHEIRTQKKFALKRIAKTAETDDQCDYIFEARLMLILNHPNITKLFKVVDLKTETFLFIEYLNCHDLTVVINSKRRKRMDEKESKLFMAQIVNGIKYLHEKNISHRDIKCDNIFVSCEDKKLTVKIGDFGLSAYDINLTDPCGTLRYAAPELMLKQNDEIYSGKKIDIWSLGIVFYCILSGKFPLFDESKSKLRLIIINAEIRFKPNYIWKAVSQDAKELLLAMACKDTQQRYDIHQVENHNWFQNDEISANNNKSNTLLKRKGQLSLTNSASLSKKTKDSC